MKGNKTVVVTGANGLLGRNLLELLSPAWDVEAFVHTSPSFPVPGVNYRVVDFSVDWDLDALPKKAYAIFHLAQSSNFRNVPEHALDVFQVNIASTARLLDYAWRSGVKRFAYASSGGIYNGESHAFSENSPIIQPNTLGYYLGSKVSGEALVSSYAKYMRIFILRFFFIYGANQNRSMLIPRLVDKIRAGSPVSIHGENGLCINPIHVADAAKAVAATLESDKSAIYNIGGPEIVSLRTLCDEIADLTGRTVQYDVIDDQPLDVIGDISLMRSYLHEPIIRPRDGVRDLV